MSRSSNRSTLTYPGKVQKGLIHVSGPVRVTGCIRVPKDVKVLTQSRKVSGDTYRVRGLKGKFDTNRTINRVYDIWWSQSVRTDINKNCLQESFSKKK